MPRHARKKSESDIFHVMMRGINKQTIFEDDEDRERILETIERYKTVSEYEIYGYCLMNNHVHLLMKETKELISTIIKRICSSYVYWYNWKYERCGHLFQERYKSETVENEGYLLTVLRYIHQNPVKAGLSKNIKEYKWSSYNEYINEPTIVDTGLALQIFSTNREKAVSSFIAHSNEKSEDKCLDYDEKNRLTDNDVRKYFKNLGIKNIRELQQIDISKRNAIIKEIKAIKYVTIRQLSRITGISKSVIDRI